MITIEQIKNKIQECYNSVDKRDLFYSVEKEKNVKFTDEYINNTFSLLITELAFSYFIEIAKINLKCNDKIINIDDVYFPLKRMSYYILTNKSEKYSIFFIETKTHVYVIKDKLYNMVDFYFGLSKRSYEERTDRKKIQWIQDLKDFVDETSGKVKQLKDKNDEKYIVNMLNLFNEKFLYDYNNLYKNLFNELVEKNDTYLVFKKNIDSSFKHITKEILTENKDKIYELLKQTDSIEENKKQKGIFNDLYYSFIFKLYRKPENPELHRKACLNMYSKDRNELRLDYLMDGNIFLHKTKLFIFLSLSDNTLLFFGDISKDEFTNVAKKLYNNNIQIEDIIKLG